jgi:hypothetical protein
MKRMTWKDGDGREHFLHRVRSLGPGRGFGVLNIYTNAVVASSYSNRAKAWSALRKMEEEAQARNQK